MGQTGAVELGSIPFVQSQLDEPADHLRVVGDDRDRHLVPWVPADDP